MSSRSRYYETVGGQVRAFTCRQDDVQSIHEDAITDAVAWPIVHARDCLSLGSFDAKVIAACCPFTTPEEKFATSAFLMRFGHIDR